MTVTQRKRWLENDKYCNYYRNKLVVALIEKNTIDKQ